MSKKNKSNRNFGNETPEVYNMDDIGYMADEAIHDRAQRLENERNRLVSMSRDPYLWEIELAYLRREQELRQTRANFHAEYLKGVGSTNVRNDADDSANDNVNELN